MELLDPNLIINYGLIVIDSQEELGEDEAYTIVHFCGYENKPTELTKIQLREELATNEDFELTDIVDDLEILDCPADILELYKQSYRELIQAQLN